MTENKSFISYKRDIVKISNKKNVNAILDFEDAENEVVEYLTQQKVFDLTNSEGSNLNDNTTKDKEYLKDKKDEYRRHITDCIYEKNMSVRGYQGDKIDEFITKMVNEYAGYSVLTEAFEDPEIDDIFCITF